MASSEDFRKLVFLNYKEILEEFEKNNLKTKGGKVITHHDLRDAIDVMIHKHPSCRWQSERIRKRYYYIQYEGFIWLRDVYFTSYDLKLIDKDVKWFESRIKWYQKQFEKNNIEYPEFEYKIQKMNKQELAKYFDKAIITIEKAIRDYEKKHQMKSRIYKDGKLEIDEECIKWLLKNIFKNKYLEMLEKYKMELTEIFKANGGYYDNYFGRN